MNNYLSGRLIKEKWFFITARSPDVVRISITILNKVTMIVNNHN